MENGTNRGLANDSLRDLVFCGGLTGLYNRRYFQESLKSELERAIILPETDVTSAKVLAQQLRRGVKQMDVRRNNNQRISADTNDWFFIDMECLGSFCGGKSAPPLSQ